MVQLKTEIKNIEFVSHKSLPAVIAKFCSLLMIIDRATSNNITACSKFLNNLSTNIMPVENPTEGLLICYIKYTSNASLVLFFTMRRLSLQEKHFCM